MSEKATSRFGKKAWKREISGNGKERVFMRHIQGDNGNGNVQVLIWGMRSKLASLLKQSPEIIRE